MSIKKGLYVKVLLLALRTIIICVYLFFSYINFFQQKKYSPPKKCPLVEVHEIYGFHFKNLMLLIKFENIHFSYILFFSTKTYNICNIHQKRLFSHP